MVFTIVDIYCAWCKLYGRADSDYGRFRETKFFLDGQGGRMTSHTMCYPCEREGKKELGKIMGLENDMEMKRIEGLVKKRDEERLLKHQE
jgi:hypothetical protein